MDERDTYRVLPEQVDSNESMQGVVQQRAQESETNASANEQLYLPVGSNDQGYDDSRVALLDGTQV